MVLDKFGILLQELGTIYKTKLAPDKNNACLLKYNNGIQVQIEPTTNGRSLHVVTFLGELSQGRFRENVFREALKSNGLPSPRNGIFAYSKKGEALVLYDLLYIDEVTGLKLADFLQSFVQKAELWKGALSKGEVPSYMGNELSFGGAQKSPGGIFGLMR